MLINNDPNIDAYEIGGGGSYNWDPGSVSGGSFNWDPGSVGGDDWGGYNFDPTPYWPGGPPSSGEFNIPEGAYPESSSYGWNASQSEEAIDWNSALGRILLPLIQGGAQNLPVLAGKLGNTLQGQYNSLMRQALGPDAFQGTLNQLAGKGILNSSMAGDTLANTASTIAGEIGNRGYLSYLQGLQTQMQAPGMLGQLAELARRKDAISVSQQGSQSSNKLAPYELMASLLMY
jgi:hypothetical protein